MSLIFTDAQIESISLQVLQLPTEIQNVEESLDDFQAQRDRLLEKDGEDKVFFDNRLNIINQYFGEMKAINGTTKTLYDEADLIDSAINQAGGPHFPISPPWVNLPPKLISSNNGNPAGSVSDHEVTADTRLKAGLTLLKSGFTDSGVSDTLFSAFSGNTASVSTGGFSAGKRVVIFDGAGNAVYGIIQSVTIIPPAPPIPPPPPQAAEDVVITVIDTEGGDPVAGATIQEFHPGFINGERETLNGSSSPGVMKIFKRLLNSDVVYFDDQLVKQLAPLNANDSIGIEASEISNAKDSVNTERQNILNWQNSPATGSGVGRYGDDGLIPVDDVITARGTQRVVRLSQVLARLGAVNQAGDGTFSGSGSFFDLFGIIDQRLNKSGGDRIGYEQGGLTVDVFNQKISQLEAKDDRYDEIFFVARMADFSSGDNRLTMQDVSEFSENKIAKIIDDTNDVILTRTITKILVNNVLEFDQEIPEGYAVENNGRVVQRKD